MSLMELSWVNTAATSLFASLRDIFEDADEWLFSFLLEIKSNSKKKSLEVSTQARDKQTSLSETVCHHTQSVQVGLLLLIWEAVLTAWQTFKSFKQYN